MHGEKRPLDVSWDDSDTQPHTHTEGTRDLLSYYPNTPSKRLGRRSGQAWHKQEEDRNWNVVAPSVQTRHGDFERAKYGSCANQGEGDVWFFEREGVKDQKCSQDQEQGHAFFLPAMMEVKTTGKGGLFNPSIPLHANARVLLGRLHEVMHDSHQRLPYGVPETDLITSGASDGLWQWQRPWKKKVGGVREIESLGSSSGSGASTSGIVDCGVKREEDGAGSSMGTGGGGCQWSDWVCSEYSKHKVDSTGNKYHSSFNNHKKGSYLRVLLGYSHTKHRAVYEFAHRIVLWAFCGPPVRNGGQDLVALRACDRPTCLCVAHLSWGARK